MLFQTNLDAGLDLVSSLHKQIQELRVIRVYNGFSIIRHQSNNRGVPLIDDLRESVRAGTHKHLSNSVVELLYAYED